MGRRLLVPAAVCPRYRRLEWGGTGWEAEITGLASHERVDLKFVNARARGGNLWEPVTLPVSVLRPLPPSSTA